MKKKVNSELVERVLDYVTTTYGLTSDYTLSGFKKGKNDLQITVINNQAEMTVKITVINNQAEMTVKIFGSDMYDLLEEDMLDN